MATKKLIEKKYLNYSGVLLLKSRLPIEIIYSLHEFLFETDYKKKLDFCLIFIPYKAATKNYKRCTPCSSCKKVNTYNLLCNKCDDLKWDDLG